MEPWGGFAPQAHWLVRACSRQGTQRTAPRTVFEAPASLFLQQGSAAFWPIRIDARPTTQATGIQPEPVRRRTAARSLRVQTSYQRTAAWSLRARTSRHQVTTWYLSLDYSPPGYRMVYMYIRPSARQDKRCNTDNFPLTLNFHHFFFLSLASMFD